MEDDIHFDDVADARSSFDVQLPIQIHSRPMSRASCDLLNDANQQVSIPENTKADSDRDLLTQAQGMGLRVPEAPQQGLEPHGLIAHNGSVVTITSSQPDTITLQSRNSNSTRPTSLSSNEPQIEQRAIYSAPSIAPSLISSSKSTTSTIPRRRTNSKLRNSLKRLSILGRKKTPDASESVRPSLERYGSSISVPPRPVTAEGARSSSMPPMLPPISGSPRRTIGTLLPTLSETRIVIPGRVATSTLRPLTPPSEEKELDFDISESPSARLSRERSLHCGRLQRLRIAHLDEQSTFLSARQTAFISLRAKRQPDRERAHAVFAEKKADTLARHVAANSDLEHRHLTAEMDLERALTSERRACSTKIKYMEAYCYGSRNRTLNSAPLSAADSTKAATAAAAGMPARKVTEEDYRKLVEQYNLRNGMDQLHAARINVLREQQAKQAERIGRKQEGEVTRLQQERDSELGKIEQEVQRDISWARQEWSMKKRRMVWRWRVKEAIERKTLEMERGEKYGELPDVIWPAEESENPPIVERPRVSGVDRLKRLSMEVRSIAETEPIPESDILSLDGRRGRGLRAGA